MKAPFKIAALAVLVVVPGVCFALWDTELVTKDRAKELGMEVRTTAAGPNHVQVELEFKTEGKFGAFSPEGKFKDRSGVELWIGEGDNLAPLRESKLAVAAPLREDRSKPGRVVVRFTANRTRLDQINLRVMAPFQDDKPGGTYYDLRVKDFVELKKDR